MVRLDGLKIWGVLRNSEWLAERHIALLADGTEMSQSKGFTTTGTAGKAERITRRCDFTRRAFRLYHETLLASMRAISLPDPLRMKKEQKKRRARTTYMARSASSAGLAAASVSENTRCVPPALQGCSPHPDAISNEPTPTRFCKSHVQLLQSALERGVPKAHSRVSLSRGQHVAPEC